MSSLNKIILVGTVHSEPEIRATTTGESLAKFALMVERPERGEGLPKQSDLIQIVAWRQLADTLKEVAKGDMLLVDGRISSRSFDDAQGVKRYVTEVEAKEVRRLGGGDLPSVARAPRETIPAVIKEKKVDAVEAFDFGNEGFDPGELQFPEGFDAKALAKEIDEEVPF